MTTLYDAAVRNYRAAADILEALQAHRQNLVHAARAGLVGRPRLSLSGGYNDITASFGLCLPQNGRAEMLAAEAGPGIDLRCSGADWLTLEGDLPLPVSGEACHVEMRIDAGRPMVADVFLREFREDGSVHDTGHRECCLNLDAVTICRLPLPQVSDEASGMRVIIHLRQPPSRMLLDLLATTLT